MHAVSITDTALLANLGPIRPASLFDSPQQPRHNNHLIIQMACESTSAVRSRGSISLMLAGRPAPMDRPPW